MMAKPLPDHSTEKERVSEWLKTESSYKRCSHSTLVRSRKREEKKKNTHKKKKENTTKKKIKNKERKKKKKKRRKKGGGGGGERERDARSDKEGRANLNLARFPKHTAGLEMRLKNAENRKQTN